ncbi:MAG: cobalt ECF transporter T component CbiQ [bacterium]
MGIANWIEIGRMDELGRMDTPVHRVDARAKAVVTFTFIAVVMSFPVHEVSALTPFLLFPVALVALGRIPARHILSKILIAAPFALVVGMFNPFMDRQPFAAIGPFTVTGGWMSFTSIMLRFVLTVGAALALVACTGMNRLGAGLGRLGVPRVFVVQLLFLYRYLFVVADEGSNMFRSVELRSERARPLSLRTYGSLIGTLLLKSMDRAERVYRAMVARGFDGEIRMLRRSSFRWTDSVFIGGWLAYFIAARAWNLADVLGLLLTTALSGTPQ